MSSAPLFGRHGAVLLLVAGWIAGTAGPSEGLPDRHTPVIASPMAVVAAHNSALLMSQERGGEIGKVLVVVDVKDPNPPFLIRLPYSLIVPEIEHKHLVAVIEVEDWNSMHRRYRRGIFPNWGERCCLPY